MNIYEALKSDHEKVKLLLNELISLDDDDQDRRSHLVEEIRGELVPHSRAEESVFYNPLRTLASDTHPVWHGYKEHLEAESLLRMLQVEDKFDTSWRETARKLKEALEHHIQEEEGTVFSMARNLISQPEADMLGTAFQSLKSEVRDDGFMRSTLDMVANMMPPRLSEFLRISDTPKVGSIK